MKILVVEDNPDTLALIQFILKKAHYEVYLAENGEKGLKIANDILPDLILIDIMMPEMDGYTLNELLKENPKTKDIPIVISTARVGLYKLFGSGKNSKIDGYLTKPFSPEELIEVIGKILDKRNK